MRPITYNKCGQLSNTKWVLENLVINEGCFFPWDIVSLLPWDALSLVRFVCGTFCPVGRFVPWDVLSLGPYVGKLMSLGRFVPWDVLSRGT